MNVNKLSILEKLQDIGGNVFLQGTNILYQLGETSVMTVEER